MTYSKLFSIVLITLIMSGCANFFQELLEPSDLTHIMETGSVDTTLPLVTITSPLDGDNVPSAFLVSGTATDNREVEDVFVRYSGGIYTFADFNQTTGAWSKTISLPTNGYYYIEVFAKDSSGNSSKTNKIQVVNIEYYVKNVPIYSSYFREFAYPIEHNSKLYFQGYNGYGQTLAYIYDNHRIVSSSFLSATNYSGGFSDPVIFNNQLCFQGSNFVAEFFVPNLCVYNNSVLPTLEVQSNCNYDTGFSQPVVFDGKLFFSAYFSASPVDVKIYMYDGDKIQDVPTNYGCDYERQFYSPMVFNQKLYFLGESTNSESKIYVYDGSNINNVSVDGGSDYLECFDYPVTNSTRLYFGGHNGSKTYVYYVENNTVYDGPRGNGYSANFQSPIVFQDNIFFEGNHDTLGIIAFKIENDSISTLSAGDSGHETRFINPVVYNDNIYFEGFTSVPVTRYLVYFTDGSTIKSVTITSNSDYYAAFDSPCVFNSQLFFRGQDTNYNEKIYSLNSLGFNSINISPYSDYKGMFESPVVFDESLIFCAETQESIYRIFEYSPNP